MRLREHLINDNVPGLVLGGLGLDGLGSDGLGLAKIDGKDVVHNLKESSWCTDWGSVKLLDVSSKILVLLKKKKTFLTN